MTRCILALVALGALIAAGIRVAAPADAVPLDQVMQVLRDAHGHYQRGGASLTAADCSGLVSVAQSLAMGQKPRRLGSTRSLLTGAWPHAIPGATPDDRFVIGADYGHMSAKIGNTRIEATCCGRPFLIGPKARSPFTFEHIYHVDPEVLA